MQATAVAAAIVYSGAMSFVLLKVISLVVPLRATGSDESTGLDISAHGEEAYLHSDGGGLSRTMMKESAPPRRVESLAPATK